VNTFTVLQSATSSVQDKGNKVVDWLAHHHILAAFLLLLVLEICVFGSVIGKVGVYLDEWVYFHELHFCGQTWPDLLKCLLFDERLVIRPLYTPYLATIYYFFHERPLGYHLLNQAWELGGAFCLYLALTPVLKDKVLSFLTAAIFLIYPSHDLTHYSITANSTTIAITLYTFSLWQLVRGIERKQIGLVWLSAFFFLISLLTYEICLPLIIVFPALAAVLLVKDPMPFKVLVLSLLYSIPSVMAVGLVVFYRAALRLLNLGWNYGTVINPIHFMQVIYEGIKVSISPYAFSFFWTLSNDTLKDKLSLLQVLALILISATLIVAVWISTETDFVLNRRSSSSLAIVIGTLILISSYVIFGFTLDYLPVLNSGLNRINAASSIGAALIISGFFGWLSSFINVSTTRMQSISFSCLLIPCMLLFVLADWQFAGPWIVSWRAQKQVMTIIECRANQIHSGDTIILANLPRYTMWAPVFDGHWDFQSELRIKLNRQDINGGVLSDRLVITPTALEDRFQTVVCARYPLKQLYLFVPSPETWITIHSPQELIALAKRYGIVIRTATDTKHY